MKTDDNVIHLAEVPIDGDRLFFEQHPERNFRVRYAGPREIHYARRLGGAPPPPGCRLFIVVQRLGPGFRFRRFLTMPESLDLRIGDDEIEGILEYGFIPIELLGGNAA